MIILGCSINVFNFGLRLLHSYNHNDQISYAYEESENSEEKESENSDKEDSQGKDKIVYPHDNKISTVLELAYNRYPDLYKPRSSEFIEHKTPPPEYCSTVFS
ncbi:hypothetical protein [Aquimarina sp. U1-2]|uniref:hypothetical protein n=1 Tax=Aquimarina sp. U1-2 TaxID=2823141 RepID=UPI001AECE5AB|nr:hypothetical protein [Aquimarina sp. U1-2]